MAKLFLNLFGGVVPEGCSAILADCEELFASQQAQGKLRVQLAAHVRPGTEVDLHVEADAPVAVVNFVRRTLIEMTGKVPAVFMTASGTFAAERIWLSSHTHFSG
jgi:hypothetical protein